MENNYSKREMDLIVSAIKSEIEEGLKDVKDTLNRIETQTIKTNGRVSVLENWRWLMTGGLVIIGVIVVPLFLNLLK